MTTAGWLGSMLGTVELQDHGTAVKARTALDFEGDGLVVTDDSANGRTKITVALPPGSSTPTGDGFVHITAGVQDAAAATVAINAETTGTLITSRGGTGTIEGSISEFASNTAGAVDDLDVGVTKGVIAAVRFAGASTEPTGFVSPAGGGSAMLTLYHPNGVTCANEDAGSAAGNRILNWPEVAMVPQPLTSAILVYQSGLTRWVFVAGTA